MVAVSGMIDLLLFIFLELGAGMARHGLMSAWVMGWLQPGLCIISQWRFLLSALIQLVSFEPPSPH